MVLPRWDVLLWDATTPSGSRHPESLARHHGSLAAIFDYMPRTHRGEEIPVERIVELRIAASAALPADYVADDAARIALALTGATTSAFDAGPDGVALIPLPRRDRGRQDSERLVCQRAIVAEILEMVARRLTPAQKGNLGGRQDASRAGCIMVVRRCQRRKAGICSSTCSMRARSLRERVSR